MNSIPQMRSSKGKQEVRRSRLYICFWKRWYDRSMESAPTPVTTAT